MRKKDSWDPFKRNGKPEEEAKVLLLNLTGRKLPQH